MSPRNCCSYLPRSNTKPGGCSRSFRGISGVQRFATKEVGAAILDGSSLAPKTNSDSAKVKPTITVINPGVEAKEKDDFFLK